MAVSGGIGLDDGNYKPLFGVAHVRFSNRPFRVKRFQTIHRCSVDVAHGLALLFGIGTKALPSWDSKTRWNNLWLGVAVRRTVGSKTGAGQMQNSLRSE